MGEPRVAAIVLQFGQWQHTVESVSSLLHSRLKPYRIVVVDNASPDESLPRIAEWLSTKGPLARAAGDAAPQNEALVLLAMDHNGGYAAGNNAGIRQASDADAYLILNNDAILAPDALGHMWESLRTAPHPGLCGPTIVYSASGRQLIQCCGGGWTDYRTGLSTFAGEGLTLDQAKKLSREEVERNLNFICGACVLVSHEFLRRVGPMDEGFFLYCEEQDWAIRARHRFSLSWAPEAVCYHHEGLSTGWSRHSFNWRSGMRLLRSRLRLALLHHPRFLPTVALGCLFAMGRTMARRLAPPKGGGRH